MNEPAHEIAEVEAPAFLNDPKVLAYLEGTDADMSRLVLEEDDKLWAYSKRNPHSLCRCSLEDLVVLAFPAYLPATATPASKAAPAVKTPAPRSKAPAKPKKPQALSVVIPTTGTAKGLLAARQGDGRPYLLINGSAQPCPLPVIEGDTVQVCLAERKRLVGRVCLGKPAFDLLVNSPDRLDTWLFNLINGQVTTRARSGTGDVAARPLQKVLAELGSNAPILISPIIPA